MVMCSRARRERLNGFREMFAEAGRGGAAEEHREVACAPGARRKNPKTRGSDQRGEIESLTLACHDANGFVTLRPVISSVPHPPNLNRTLPVFALSY
jgi:hypothetical protein